MGLEINIVAIGVGVMIGYLLGECFNEGYRKQLNDFKVKYRGDKVKLDIYESQIERLKDKLEIKEFELNKKDFGELIQQSKEEVLTDLYNIGLFEDIDVLVGFDNKVKCIKKPCKKE